MFYARLFRIAVLSISFFFAGCHGDDNSVVQVQQDAFTISGTVNGLTGSGLVLQNNAGDDLAISANGSFTFATALTNTSAYAVTVSTQPSGASPTPTCSVANSSGTLSGSNITDITVDCSLLVTVDSTEPKTLTFSWPAVTGATYYKLMKNPDGASGFSQVGSNIVALTVDEIIPVHLHDWSNASYTIDACNASDVCISSSVITTTTLMLNAIGYFKGSNSVANYQLGRIMTMSSDGTIFAVGTNTNEGFIYVFRWSSGTGWTQDTIIQPNSFIFSMSLSGDGNTLALGTSTNQALVYKYTTSWALDTTISGPGSSITYGISVSLSRDGLTLAVGDTNFSSTRGAAYVYRDNGSSWPQLGSDISASDNAGDTVTAAQFGRGVTLSNNGNTLAVGAIYADTASVVDAGKAYVYRWSAGAWGEEAILEASDPGGNRRFGQDLDLSDDGNTLAIGRGSQASVGSAYVFRFSGTWSQQGSPLVATGTGGEGLGTTIAISADGNTLVTGAVFEDSSSTGINPAPDELASNAGAAYVFTFSASSWSESAFVKSRYTEAVDIFGTSVAISADGQTIGVGTPGDDSNSTGINSTPNDDGSTDTSGAIYIY